MLLQRPLLPTLMTKTRRDKVKAGEGLFMTAHGEHRDEHSSHVHQMSHREDGPATTADGLKDPVCGMTVKEQSPHRLEYQGHTHYFCSAGCAAKFAADPEKYLAPQPAPASAERTGTIYTCPMHPGDSARSSRQLSDLRHGARTVDAIAGGRGKPGTQRFLAPLLVDAAANVRSDRACDVRTSLALV